MEAFEGNRDIFKTMGEKAKKLSKVVLKEAKKAVGLHVGDVSEANPIYYIVVASQGAMVRKAIELDSAPVHGLRRGDLVTCVDLSGRRARIIDPVEGWVSTRTGDNELILEPTIAPDKHIQVSLMEKRFDKLKSEQQQNQQLDDQDKAVPAPGQSSAIPETVVKESDYVAVNAIKAKLTFKNIDGVSSTPKPAGFVPKLSGPCMKRAVDTVPVGQDLVSLDSPKHAPELISASSPPALSTQGPPIPAYVDPFADLLSSTHSLPVAAKVVVEAPKFYSGPSSLNLPPATQPVSKPQDNAFDWFN